MDGHEQHHNEHHYAEGLVDTSERRKIARKETTAIMALVFTVAVQTGGFIWWAATLTANMQNLTATISELKQDRYSKLDAVKDMDRLRDKDSEMERRITALEVKTSK